MMKSSTEEKTWNKITFLVGEQGLASGISCVAPKKPFSDDILVFLNTVSRELMGTKNARDYSDVITFAFWIRKASLEGLKKWFFEKDSGFCIGRGVVFHVAPSNVPVNFAYSFIAALLCGNASIVRVPSREFPQTEIILNAFRNTLEKYPEMKPYMIFVRYDRDREINDLLSSLADVRIIWGGDRTIEELRRSPLLPRSTEITFADRYSLAVIDSDRYLEIPDKVRMAEDFYNDTYLTDQNACTSPHLIVWTGSRIEEAKRLFWEEVYQLVKKRYLFQDIQGINKMTKRDLLAAIIPGCHVPEMPDNLILRMQVPKITENLMDYRENSGFFLEYDCKDILDLRPVCNDARCQTVAMIGDPEMMKPLMDSGIKGIDRIVPMGKTMDFDLIWDGYDLTERLTRRVMVQGQA